MLWVPAASADVEQVAVRVLPLPASATAAQPAIDAAPSLKLTVPVGAEPVTVAVKVTLAPNGRRRSRNWREWWRTVALTTCDSAALVDARLPVSPP